MRSRTMRKQKRDSTQRHFNRGYQIGLAGKSRDLCPLNNMDERAVWMSGWRSGREAYWGGMSGVAALHRDPSLG
ncbi:ribosome modulation factor [Balneatrix alpica]|uniref:ribosome modulation factor n=2 Tax=Balneatrix alpica TaxID=75684 RepID=UPI0034E983A6